MIKTIEIAIITLIATIVSVMAAMYFIERHRANEIHAQHQDPAILIVDVAKTASDMVKNGDLTKEDADMALIKVLSEIERLKNEGFIVLDARQVIRAPDRYYYDRQ